MTSEGFLQGTYLATIATWIMIIGVTFLILVSYITSRPRADHKQTKKK